MVDRLRADKVQLARRLPLWMGVLVLSLAA